MNPSRSVFLIFLTLGVIACNRNQPPGVPDSVGSRPVAEPARTAATPPPEQVPLRELKEPPPLDGDIPPYAKTGFPDCDSYIEEYRQCLNFQLGGDQRKAAAHELTSAMNAITGSISRKVEPSRIANRCKRSRKLTAPKLESYGCTMQAE